MAQTKLVSMWLVIMALSEVCASFRRSNMNIAKENECIRKCRTALDEADDILHRPINSNVEDYDDFPTGRSQGWPSPAKQDSEAILTKLLHTLHAILDFLTNSGFCSSDQEFRSKSPDHSIRMSDPFLFALILIYPPIVFVIYIKYFTNKGKPSEAIQLESAL